MSEPGANSRSTEGLDDAPLGRIGLSIERRGRRHYLYLCKRLNGRLHRTYVRPLSEADLAAVRAAKSAVENERIRNGTHLGQNKRLAASILKAGVEFDREADAYFRGVMHAAGYHLHKRSEWRLRRGNSPMQENEVLAESPPTSAPPGAPPTAGLRPRRPMIPAPISQDPATQKILDRAAVGDRSVLGEVQKLLARASTIDDFGDLARYALDQLIATAAGDNLVIAEGVRKKYEEILGRFLADAGASPSFAEELAATRAAHAALAVHLIELGANKQAPGSPAAVSYEKHLSKAEQRLAAAMKSCGLLSRIKTKVVFKQVNVANGPMLVDNRNDANRPVPAEPTEMKEETPTVSGEQ